MYSLHTTRQFEKDFKLCIKRGLKMILINADIEHLEQNGNLPTKYNAHKLRGNYFNFWECHIQPDW